MEDYNSAGQQTKAHVHASPPQYRETFFIVPRDILEMPGMTFSYLKVFEIIYQFWNKGRQVYVGETSFCERTKLSRRQLYNALEYFEKQGKIVRTLINGRRIITQPEMSLCMDEPPCTLVHPPVHSSAPTPCTPVHVEIKKGNKEDNIKEKIYKKENEPPKQEVARYQETLYPMPVSAKPQNLAVNELASINPHNIPIEMIVDWLSVRKGKKTTVTPTAWKRINKQLGLCDDPVDAFEIMVSHGWSSLNHTWIANMKRGEKKSGHFDYDDTSWADEENKGMFD